MRNVAKSRIANPKPTFADGPSTFLSNLSAKPKPRAESQMGNINPTSEIQRVQTDLQNQIELIINKYEAANKQLHSKFNQLHQDLKPKIAALEQQQSSTQKQIDDTRDRIRKILIEELSPLQNQYDQMGLKYDRFIRADIESKLKPMHEQLRNSRIKNDELNVTSSSSIKRLTDSLRDYQENLSKFNANFQTQKNQTVVLDEALPKITALEQRLRQLKELSNNVPISQDNNGLEQYVFTILSDINRIENEVLPKKIEESNVHFIDAIKQLGQYCEEQVSNLQTQLETLNENNEAIETWRKSSEESLETLMKTSFDMQNKTSAFDQNTRSRIANLEQMVNSTFVNLNTQATDVQTADNTGTNRSIGDDALTNFKKKFDAAVDELENDVKTKSVKNTKRQQETLNILSAFRKQINENLLDRLNNAEEEIANCVELMNNINLQRKVMNEKTANQLILIARIEEAERRLSLTEDRLAKLDNEKAVQPRSLTSNVEQVSPLPVIVPIPQNENKSNEVEENNEEEAIQEEETKAEPVNEEGKNEETKVQEIEKPKEEEEKNEEQLKDEEKNEEQPKDEEIEEEEEDKDDEPVQEKQNEEEDVQSRDVNLADDEKAQEGNIQEDDQKEEENGELNDLMNNKLNALTDEQPTEETNENNSNKKDQNENNQNNNGVLDNVIGQTSSLFS